MSFALLERAADALGPLTSEVTFVGGATLSLWLPPAQLAFVRTTNDVDVVVEVATRPAFHRFEARLRDLGFREEQVGGPICRWNHGSRDQPLVVDVMPTDASILGFANVWQARAIVTAADCELPSGSVIRAIEPPFLIATKLEAFRGRGAGEFGLSHDMEDVITLVDRRPQLVDECRAASSDVQEYLAAQIRDLLATAAFVDQVSWHLRPDAASQDRVDAVVLPRLQALAALA